MFLGFLRLRHGAIFRFSYPDKNIVFLSNETIIYCI
jgi:hypothetical protein